MGPSSTTETMSTAEALSKGADMHMNLKETRDPVADIYGERTPYHGDGQWPVRVDECTVEEPEKWVQSACVLCSNGCGMDVGVKDGKIVGVRGRAVDRCNKGRLGPKGMSTWHVNHNKDRLMYPMVRNKQTGQLERATWDEAMGVIVERCKKTIEELSSHAIGFYTSGQLMLEEYYTLATVGKAGLNALNMDGNTRLCTATAATAMRESFGCDGQPGSYDDIDTTDCLFLVGHNIAATNTVMWTRMLDRLAGPDPPKVVVVDPRKSRTAEKATVHIRPRIGTNMAVLNGIIHLIIKADQVDHDFIKKSVFGYDKLVETVERYTPEYCETISGVPPETMRAAATIIGGAKRLLSTALQGVYQSNQATASACQINNVNLIRGMIGKSGAGIFQMNGQPTAQNNRETGCNGEFPGFRNHQNINHMKDLAKHWNIDLIKVPRWAVPVHIMSMLNSLESGLMSVFWVSGTNPATSLVDLERFRQIVTRPDIMLIVQDIFMSETAQLADVVLPAAMWAEKTGCFTNVDRTVHIAHKAIEPPGECKSDLEIFLDFAKKMEFKDKDGNDLIPWRDERGAFEHWKKSTTDRPVDYTGLSYEKLTGGSGIQWPCNEKYPNGCSRLYSDGVFPTDIENAESWGHDMETGAPINRETYECLNIGTRAILKTAHYRPPEEDTNEEYPFALSTGRNVYHFHTRTKTGRSERLENALTDPEVTIHPEDAERLDIKKGDRVVVKSRRGAIELPVRIDEITKGSVFMQFHFGSFDAKGKPPRAANELTACHWDFISKQPVFKGGAVSVTKVGPETKHPESRQLAAIKRAEGENQVKLRSQRTRRHLGDQLALLETSNIQLLALYDRLIKRHDHEFELRASMKVLRDIHHDMIVLLDPFKETHGPANGTAVERDCEIIRNSLFSTNRSQEHMSQHFDTLLDIQALMVTQQTVATIINVLVPTAGALMDAKFSDAIKSASDMIGRQTLWSLMAMKDRAPQIMLVPALLDADHDVELDRESGTNRHPTQHVNSGLI